MCGRRQACPGSLFVAPLPALQFSSSTIASCHMNGRDNCPWDTHPLDNGLIAMLSTLSLQMADRIFRHCRWGKGEGVVFVRNNEDDSVYIGMFVQAQQASCGLLGCILLARIRLVNLTPQRFTSCSNEYWHGGACPNEEFHGICRSHECTREASLMTYDRWLWGRKEWVSLPSAQPICPLHGNVQLRKHAVQAHPNTRRPDVACSSPR